MRYRTSEWPDILKDVKGVDPTLFPRAPFWPRLAVDPGTVEYIHTATILREYLYIDPKHCGGGVRRLRPIMEQLGWRYHRRLTINRLDRPGFSRHGVVVAAE
jgi:hypothetical protein